MGKKAMPILVLGGGHQGLSMAAHLALCGESVYLWNRSFDNIYDIVRTGQIHCSGVINGVAQIEKASNVIEEVLARVIMITTPATAHEEIAAMLADKVTKDHVIILNPGRTFGALRFVDALRAAGCMELPHVAETQTIVYTCRRNKENCAVIYALKRDVRIASVLSGDMELILSSIPACLRRHFVPVSSVIETSLANVGMILHCAPVLMNVGWIESINVTFKYYYDGISPSVATFIEKIDKERLAVATAFGYQLESTAEWMSRTYGTSGITLYDHIRSNAYYREIDAPQTVHHRYLQEDVPCGLVPLESAAKYVHVNTPHTTLVIDLANAMLGLDFRKTGNKFVPGIMLSEERIDSQHVKTKG